MEIKCNNCNYESNKRYFDYNYWENRYHCPVCGGFNLKYIKNNK